MSILPSNIFLQHWIRTQSALPNVSYCKTILEKYNLKDKVDLTLDENQIIIKPISNPRIGWEDSFKKMAENGEDRLLFNDVFDDENLKEWK